MSPKVSIILPTYNRCQFLPQAIESVLRQTFKNFELIIINDGSSDNTENVVKNISDPRIKYFKNNQNLGIQKTLNIGLARSRGKYIARIDDDVEWIDPDKLKKQVDFLEKNPEYVLVGTFGIIEKNGKQKFWKLPEEDEKIRKNILAKNCFIHFSVVFRKDIALEVGGYDKSELTQYAEDYDLWLRFGQKGKFANLPFFSVKFQVSEEQISTKKRMEQLKNTLLIAKKYKKYYPGYYKALIKHYMKIFLAYTHLW
jgi:glycosyltransferase involved in cell wall biosynthesis